MRESNFAFPAQNKACVCINSQLYDRRALDTTSPLPLHNSLQHLQYLTSTSPRIREIMTMDGGLERLVRILYDFCLSPPPPENPALVYGLTPPGYRPPKTSPALNPPNYDKHAALRFTLAFQCVSNIGVRGSEPIRSRVVQAGTLDVVGCVLEAWLASKGFAIGPSSSATGIPRETREQRQARRLAQAELRQREEAAALARALQRQIVFEQMQQRIQHIQQERARLHQFLGDRQNLDEIMEGVPIRARARPTLPITDGRPGINNNASDNEQSTDTFDASTSTVTPTASTSTARDRSGTVIAHQQPTHLNPQVLLNHASTFASSTSAPSDNMQYRRNTPSPSPSTDTSRAETETEDEPEHDADGDIDMDRLPRPRAANRNAAGSIASRRHVLAEARLHINANLAIQRNQQNQNLAVYPHNQALSPGSAVSTPASGSASPSPERRPPAAVMRNTARQARFGAVPDRTTTMPGVGVVRSAPGDTDPHIVISDAVVGPGVVGDNINMAMGVGMGDGGVGVGGVEDEMVSLQANDDFAMGAPPGAPGAIVLDTGMEESTEGATPREYLRDDEGRRLDLNSTPRAGVVDLPDTAGVTPSSAGGSAHLHHHHHNQQREAASIRGRSASVGEGSSASAAASASTSRATAGTRDDSESAAPGSGSRMMLDNDVRGQQPTQGRVGATEIAPTVSDAPSVATTATGNHTATTSGSLTSTPSMASSGPYRDEEVLLGLQLLAYLSKYPHVRQAFYKPRPSFHPASLGLHQASAVRAAVVDSGKDRDRQLAGAAASLGGNQSLFRTLAGRGRATLNCAVLGVAPGSASAAGCSSASVTTGSAGAPATAAAPVPQARQTNVFSLVERFTFKPSSNEADLPNPPPRLPPEIQYWAGVIMRNACRKDESRGGIRQCANMLCGRWEQYPREFAKCRRCRKAKYCGKECQSTAWSEGHRFWCSAKDGDEDGDKDRGRGGERERSDEGNQPQASTTQQMPGALDDAAGPAGPPPVSPRAERAARRERERRLRELANAGNDVSALVINPEVTQITAFMANTGVMNPEIQGRLNSAAHAAQHANPGHAAHGTIFTPGGVPSPVGETHSAGPLAGPSHGGGGSAVLTEAAAHQQRMHEHQRIMETDWFGHGHAPHHRHHHHHHHHQPQAGPSRVGWQVSAEPGTTADEVDMVLG